MANEDLQIIDSNSQITYPIDKFEGFLERFGLPTDNIIALPQDRAIIMQALPGFLQSINPEIKKDARYLSKFVAGAAIGLFDASLNYVWDEVVINLRKKVIAYGLDIFFDNAVGEKVRSQYTSEEDLKGLKDKILLDTCRKLELISDIVHKKLSHILTMRNDIGASHPNSYDINPYELLGWLSNCITDVLNDKPSDAAITVQGIISNLSKNTEILSQETIATFETAIAQLSSKMAGNLLTSLFGLFVSENTLPTVRTNILLLAPIIWNYVLDDVKYDLGEKIDVYKANLDTSRTERAATFFEHCDGKRYYSLTSKTIQLSTLCDELMDAHNSWDNYYFEPPIARQIMSFITIPEDIPSERQEKIIKAILKCRIGRAVSYCKGVSPGGKKYYDTFFSLLSPDQIILTLKILDEDDVKCNLYSDIQKDNCIQILNILKSPLCSERIIEIIDYLINHKQILNKISTDKGYKDLVRGILN